MMDFTEKRILGMIHLAGPNVIERALEEIEIYERQGLYGVIIENYHGSVNDVIYVLKKLPKTSLKIGINILPNEVNEAFKLAKNYNVDFIQFDFIAGIYNNGTQLDIGEYGNHWTYTDIFVMGGVWPKYYKPIKGSDLYADINNARMISDAIVVTGEGTGVETLLDKIKKFNEILSLRDGKKHLLIIGAGLNKNNVKEQMKYADGAIVGSAFKPNGITHKMVDEELVKEFMNALNT